MTDITVRLKARQARRVASGHAWVFANEVESVDPPDAVDGICVVVDHSDRFLGRGYYNKHSLICARLLSRDPDDALDATLFHARLLQALTFRASMYAEGQAFRWVYGEADGLPGLVVDRYPGLLVIQVSTIGMDNLQPVWEPVLRELAGDRDMIFRNDIATRRHEGASEFVAFPHGRPQEPMFFKEAGIDVAGLPLTGQGTGYFLDQRENRLWTRRFAKNRNVLDCFCYTGAWGLSLLASGAKSATLVDRSAAALDGAKALSKRLGVTESVTIESAEAVGWLRQVAQSDKRFDMVIVDPPPFIPGRKDRRKGSRSYVHLYRSAFHAAAPGGIVVLSSRSYHLDQADFEALIQEAAARDRRGVQILHRGGAGPDHPQPIAMPEARYLKCAVCLVS